MAIQARLHAGIIRTSGTLQQMVNCTVEKDHFLDRFPGAVLAVLPRKRDPLVFWNGISDRKGLILEEQLQEEYSSPPFSATAERDDEFVMKTKKTRKQLIP